MGSWRARSVFSRIVTDETVMVRDTSAIHFNSVSRSNIAERRLDV